MIGKGNRSTRRKPAPMPLCPPQTPHAARTRTRAAVVGNQQLTSWAMTRLKSQVRVNYLKSDSSLNSPLRREHLSENGILRTVQINGDVFSALFTRIAYTADCDRSLHTPHQKSGVHCASQNMSAGKIWSPELSTGHCISHTKGAEYIFPHKIYGAQKLSARYWIPTNEGEIVYIVSEVTAYTTNEHRICRDPGWVGWILLAER
jgi:hypothetical protein